MVERKVALASFPSKTSTRALPTTILHYEENPSMTKNKNKNKEPMPISNLNTILLS